VGIPKAGIEFYIKLKKLGLFDGFTSVVELGSQDIVKRTIGAQEYCDLFNKQNSQYYEEIFAENRVSARILYDDLGFEKYECIDLDEEHGAHKFDLNYNFKEKYNFNDQFDLVFNGGTTEHCFNQAACFENMHNMCKAGGVMFSAVPMDGYLDHGFFNYHPGLFKKIARANNYSIEFMLISNGESFYPLSTHLESSLNNRSDLLNSSTGSVLLVGYRKNSEKYFRFAYQDYPIADEPGWEAKLYSKNYSVINILQSVPSSYGSAAIFGCGEASKIATKFLYLAGIDIECYVDDFKSGIFLDKPIRKRDEMGTGSTVLFVGPCQRGDFDSFKQLDVQVVYLNEQFLQWYSCYMSLLSDVNIDTYINADGYLDNFYLRAPKAVAQHIITTLPSSKLLFYGTGRHTRDVLDALDAHINIVGIVRESYIGDTYIECTFNEPIYEESDVASVEFDYIVLLGNWDDSNIDKLCQKICIPVTKAYMPYKSSSIKAGCVKEIALDIALDIVGDIQTDKPIIVQLAWDSKNDIFSEASEEIAKDFYLVKIYLWQYYFENANDIYFDKIIRVHSFIKEMQLEYVYFTNNVKLFWSMAFLEVLQPRIIICTKPTANETIFDYLIMKNSPKESKFIFAPWGDIIAYKASSLDDTELIKTCGCISLDEFYTLMECEKRLITESDGVMSSLLGVYRDEVLLKETKSLLTTIFFLHPRHFIFTEHAASIVPKICYVGSLTCHEDYGTKWALAMDHREDYRKFLQQGIDLSIYTMSHGQHGCYDELKEFNNFNLYINTPHWELPMAINEYDFGLIWSNVTQDIAIKMYPSPQSVFLAKAITYLAAGLPIIVPEEIVLMSEFVKSEKIGISIPHDKAGILLEYINAVDYDELKGNVLNFQKKYISQNEPARISDFFKELLLEY